jgi:hypothetical protein
VGDQDDAATDLVTQSAQQPEHLSLHGDVEGRRRLVGNDELRVAGDRDRDHHALPETSGQFVRVGPHASLGFGDADRREQPERLGVAPRGLGDLPTDPHRGVQRGHRILEHGTEIEAANLSQRLRVTGDHVRTSHRNRAVDPGVGR